MTQSKRQNAKRRIMAAIMAAALIISGLFTASDSYAADGVGEGTYVTLKYDHRIFYGTGDGGYSNLMKASGIDDSLGERFVFCLQPHLKSPANGNYRIDKMYTGDTGTDAMLRKLVYYAKGYPGWQEGQARWFADGTWSDDAVYGIFHIALAYVTAGCDDDMKAWGGGTVKEAMYSAYWAKMKEIVADCGKEGEVPDPPEGFKVFYIRESGCQDIVGGTLENGKLTLTKKSADTSMTDKNTCYSLEGAQFTVYDADGKEAAVLTADKDGKTNAVELKVGTYTVKETKIPEGYAKAADQKVTVKAGRTATVSFEDQPKNNPVKLIIAKGDSETKKAEAQGAASLEGAVYEIKYYKHTSSGKSLAGTWRVKTDKDGRAELSEKYLDETFENSEFYTSSEGAVCFPLGTVTVQEIKAPEGYLVNDDIYSCEIKSGDAEQETVDFYRAAEAGSDKEAEEQVKRADLDFVKVADGSLMRMANVPFRITSLTTGESHVIVTDKNGYASTASSWNRHTENTNRGESPEDGIWFGEAEPDNSKGALIYDDYEIEEIRCAANKGYDLKKIKVSVYKDSVTVHLGTMTDDRIEIGTQASDKADGDKVLEAGAKVTVTDTVKYSGLQAGTEYKLIGRLIDKSTGKTLEAGGKLISSEVTFTAEKSDGTAHVEFTFDTTGLEGKELVVFEKLYFAGDLIADHEDINDEGQTVKVEKTPLVPATGDSSSVRWYIAAGIAALLVMAGIAAEWVRKNRRGETGPGEVTGAEGDEVAEAETGADSRAAEPEGAGSMESSTEARDAESGTGADSEK